MSIENQKYPRDLTGYGRHPPHAQWPGGARIALQFVLNFEEGGENSVLHGDPASEVFLSEIIGAQAFPMRHMSMESLYEYGSRAGLWRVLRVFERHQLPLTIFAVAMAIARHPEAVSAFKELGHEIASHGLRWISYQQVDGGVVVRECSQRLLRSDGAHLVAGAAERLHTPFSIGRVAFNHKDSPVDGGLDAR